MAQMDGEMIGKNGLKLAFPSVSKVSQGWLGWINAHIYIYTIWKVDGTTPLKSGLVRAMINQYAIYFPGGIHCFFPSKIGGNKQLANQFAKTNNDVLLKRWR